MGGKPQWAHMESMGNTQLSSRGDHTLKSARAEFQCTILSVFSNMRAHHPPVEGGRTEERLGFCTSM